MNENENEMIYLLRNRNSGEILGVFSSKEILQEKVCKEVTSLLNLSKMTKEKIRTLMGGNFIIEAWELNK